MKYGTASGLYTYWVPCTLNTSQIHNHFEKGEGVQINYRGLLHPCMGKTQTKQGKCRFFPCGRNPQHSTGGEVPHRRSTFKIFFLFVI